MARTHIAEHWEDVGPRTPGSDALRRLPLVLAATFLLILAPGAVAWDLERSGAIVSWEVGLAAAIVVSLLLGEAAEAAWARRSGGIDAVFSELFLWGWLRRLRDERRLGDARHLHAELAAGAGTARGRRGERMLRRLVADYERQAAHLRGHSRRVSRHAAAIARTMGLERAEVRRIRTAAFLHDIGKLEVPAAVLEKAGPLTPEEFALIRRHPAASEAFVRGLGDRELSSIVRHHHERIDGGGYPDGIAGQDIPLGARIVAVADTFDSITSARAYHAPASHRQALDILREASGTQLDPAVVTAFLREYAGRRPMALGAGLGAWLATGVQRLSGVGATGGLAVGRLGAVAAIGLAGGLGVLGFARPGGLGGAAPAVASLPAHVEHGSSRASGISGAGGRRPAFVRVARSGDAEPRSGARRHTVSRSRAHSRLPAGIGSGSSTLSAARPGGGAGGSGVADTSASGGATATVPLPGLPATGSSPPEGGGIALSTSTSVGLPGGGSASVTTHASGSRGGVSGAIGVTVTSPTPALPGVTAHVGP